MLFVFGWGKRTHTDHGPALEVSCPVCHNQSYWHYKHYRTWFTLFFIPVIPYDSFHYLMCNVCQRVIGLNESEQERAKALTGYTAQFLKHQISPEEYQTRISQAKLLR